MQPTTGRDGAPANTATANAADQAENEQKDIATKRHLQAILYAIHAYAEANEGKLPPGIVSESESTDREEAHWLCIAVAVSRVRPSLIEENNPSGKPGTRTTSAPRAIHAKIDLTKAWDDPANAAAANRLSQSFSVHLSQQLPMKTNGLTHFAMVPAD